MTDYGYEVAAPDSDKNGYGDAPPDSASDPFGYGDGAPDSEAATTDKDSYAAPDDGYTYQSAYNDETTRRHPHASSRGNLQPDDPRQRFLRNPRSLSSDDALTVATVESYGDYGSGDSGDETAQGMARPRRQRYRRRGSVTKYSLDAQDTVKNEFIAHAAILNQYRTQAMDLVPPHVTQQSIDDRMDISVRFQGQPVDEVLAQGMDISVRFQGGEPVEQVLDSGDDEHDDDDDDGGEHAPVDAASKKSHKQKRKSRFRRFTMGL